MDATHADSSSAPPTAGTVARLTRRTTLGFLLVGASGLIAACTGGGNSQPAATSAPAKPTEAPAAKPAATTAPAGAAQPAASAAPAAQSSAAAGGNPSYYPANYNEIVDASKKEQKLVVYSIMSKANWAPVVEEFKKKYSWIEIDAPDMDSATLFDRYYTESAGNTRTADMVMTSTPDSWQEFQKRGEVQVYKSAEDDKVPGWSKLGNGIYTVSSDPMVIIYNKKLLQNPPKKMADLADMATRNAGMFTPGKITTYEENNGTGFAGNWFWAKKQGQAKAFEILSAIGKTKPKLESSAGRMVDATIAGETLVGYFVSAISVLPKFPAANEILGWNMIEDGTPLIVRGQAITKRAQSPNSAKLLLDFILSSTGQLAWSKGGLTAYRDDVKDQAEIHLAKFTGQIGQDNLLPFSFDPDIADKAKTDDFRAKLASALGR
ncbi:MAG: ABC transporter substrate-binding protein [Chloroflexi bacterium]|nr:ABC transporter substrate-binding protein [Chloroflexota bacterium]